MDDMLIGLWLIGFIASIVFLIASIVVHKKTNKNKNLIVISGIVSFIMGVPVVLGLLFIMYLSTNLSGM